MAQIGSSGWENNMKRVAVATFNMLLLLTRNFNRKISINQNMSAHSLCLLMSGAVQCRYYCIYPCYTKWKCNYPTEMDYHTFSEFRHFFFIADQHYIQHNHFLPVETINGNIKPIPVLIKIISCRNLR